MLWLSPLSLFPLIGFGATLFAILAITFFNQQIPALSRINRWTLVIALASSCYNLGAAVTYSQVDPELARWWFSWQQVCLSFEMTAYIFLVLETIPTLPLAVPISTSLVSLFMVVGHTLIPAWVFTDGYHRISVFGLWLRIEPNVTNLSLVAYTVGLLTIVVSQYYVWREGRNSPFPHRTLMFGTFAFVACFVVDATIVIFQLPWPYFIELGQLFLLSAILSAASSETLSEYKQTVRFNRMRSRIMDNLSHELRTPIGVVRGYLDMVIKGRFGELNSRQLQVLERAQESANRQVEQIDDLLLAALIEKRGIDPRVEKIALFPVLAEIAHDLEQRYQSTGTHLIFAFEKNVDVEGDPLLIRKMLHKLISNAFVHSPRDSTIYLNMYGCTETVYISIDDNGPGIPPEMMALATAQFTQLRDASGLSRGIGLGLSIAAEIALVHRGRLVLENRPGGGLHVEVILPLSAAVTESSDNVLSQWQEEADQHTV